ncbi:MAG: hypothetical protein U5K54_10805 [Cytophagales bacterium]|nr:hypothetical protein [Cytophagales bacterium]
MKLKVNLKQNVLQSLSWCGPWQKQNTPPMRKDTLEAFDFIITHFTSPIRRYPAHHGAPITTTLSGWWKSSSRKDYEDKCVHSLREEEKRAASNT